MYCSPFVAEFGKHAESCYNYPVKFYLTNLDNGGGSVVRQTKSYFNHVTTLEFQISWWKWFFWNTPSIPKYKHFLLSNITFDQDCVGSNNA
jgi:hypothetical protein